MHPKTSTPAALPRATCSDTEHADVEAPRRLLTSTICGRLSCLALDVTGCCRSAALSSKALKLQRAAFYDGSVSNLSSTYTGFTSLDQAYDLWLAAEPEAAARLASAVLVDHPDELGAALLLTQLLVDADRLAVAGPCLEALVPRFAARGNLPAACVAAIVGAEAGEYCGGALRTLARAFSRDSAQRSAMTLPPPPLPSTVQVPPEREALNAEPLWLAVEQQLHALLLDPEPPPAPTELPTLALFGELSEEVLYRLLGAVAVRTVAAGQAVISQGEDGDEAFVVVRGLLNVVRSPQDTVLAVLGPMAIFGEMALLGEVPRAAHVIAVEPTQVLVMQREQLEQLAQLEPAMGGQLARFCHRRMLDNLMRHSPFLSSLSTGERAELLARFVTRAYGRGENLLEQGTENNRLIVVASGEVEVRMQDTDGDELSVARLGPGEVVGEISLVLRRPVSADVVAAHNSVTIELAAQDFQAAIEQHPTLLRDLYGLALRRDEETRSLLAQKATDVSDVVLL